MSLVILTPVLYMGKLFLVIQLHMPYCVFLMGMPREIKTDNSSVQVSNVFGLFVQDGILFIRQGHTMVERLHVLKL